MAAEDDSEIPDTGAVFTFGKSKFADNLPNKFWVRNDRVIDVACGDEHTALVAESGRIFTFGSNDWGQLGLGSNKTADRPCCIKSLKSEKVKLVACGRTHTLVATESGKLYAFGNNGEGQLGVEDLTASNVPKCIDSLVTQQYKMLAAGADHSVALTEDGALFVWGGGSEGQLGLGGKTEALDPEELMIEDKITCISCGYYHTAMVTESGYLYTFGESEGGKLGLGDDIDESDTPQKVEIAERVTSVACGGSHTMALTESGAVYTFGEGQSGQLGHGTQCLQTFTPKKLNINFKVTAIACGENHSSFISDKGHLYTFGDSRHGKLASGQDRISNQFTPLKVKRFSKFTVQKVSCGGCHMICLSKPNQENGFLPSSEDETISEPKMNGMLNHSLNPDGSIDLNNSVTARDRRRKHNDSFKIDLNRTLPPLVGQHKIQTEILHQTVLVVKTRTIHSSPAAIEHESDSKSSEDEDIHEDVKADGRQEDASPKPAPRLPRRPPMQNQASMHSDAEDESDQETELTEAKQTVSQAPMPPKRLMSVIDKISDSEGDSEGEEKKEQQKKKKPKKKKKQEQATESKKTEVSKEEDDDYESADEEIDKVEDSVDKSNTKSDEKKEAKWEKGKQKKDKKKDEETKATEEEGNEDNDDKDKKEKEKETKEKKDKKSEKKDKNKKADKKTKKKDDDGGGDKVQEQEDQENDKKKDKNKKKNKGKEEEEKVDKKKETETEQKETEEDKVKKTDATNNKDDKKPLEPLKKKSRTCTIL